MMLGKHENFLRNTDLGLLVLRLNVGGLMLFHGIHKAVHGVDGIAGMLTALGCLHLLHTEHYSANW